MKKLTSILLAALLILALAACGTQAPVESAQPAAADHYLNALYYNADGSLSTIDHYDARGHMLGDEVYDQGAVTLYEEFRPAEGVSFDIHELEENSEVVSTEYQELFVRSGEEGSEFASDGKIFAFGYDANGHMKMAKVFILAEDGSVWFDYLIYYQLDEHGNFTGWTHMTENGDVLFEMLAELTYDGGRLASAKYNYTRYGVIRYDEDCRYEATETASSSLDVVFEY